ncbi:ABC transporter permease [Spirosoma arboris]|nr:ABC transporter permease [Spirosoma arboris]
MLTNYIKIALRNLWRHQLYSLINIGGLAVGIAVSLLILLYVVHEHSYDRFHPNADRTVRLSARMKRESMDINSMSLALSVTDRIRRQVPQVEVMTRLISGDWQGKDVVQYRNTPLYVKGLYYAEPSFFDLFNFQMKQGDGRKALSRPQTVILTETLAKNLFGQEDPMGKTLMFNQKHPLEVAGVMQDLPSNTIFSFPLLISASTFNTIADEWQRKNGAAGETFMRLSSTEDIKTIASFINKHISLSDDPKEKITAYTVPITQQHLSPDGGSSATAYVSTFFWVGLSVLLLALINYMNLTTARATIRAKEVGMRKALGGSRGALIWQFFTESTLLSALAFGLGISLLIVAKTPFMTFINTTLDDSFLWHPYFIGTVVSVFIISILLAGSYPALLLSGFAPLNVLKGHFTRTDRFGVRRTLVVFQFVLSGGLIFCTLVVQRQLNHMQTKDLGLSTERVMGISMAGPLAKNYASFRNEIRQQSGVQHVAAGGLAIFDGGFNIWSAKTAAIKSPITLLGMSVDNEFIETLQLHWKLPPHGKAAKYTVISQTAAKELGIAKNPIGQSVSLGEQQKEVAGVLDDFFLTSVKNTVNPIILFVGPDTSRNNAEFGGTFYIRFHKQANLLKQVATLEGIFHKYAPEMPFKYYFLDEAFNNLFQVEQRLANVLNLLTNIAILIACLGLFGLAAFTAEQRTKEIGVRKVLGASVASIVTLLSKDFLKLVLIAIVIASPIAWWAMNRWLQDFAYKIDIEWWMFALVGLLAVGITLLTVSFQSIKAALTNPVKSLRSE